MIRVTVELLKKGNPENVQHLGTAYIRNVGGSAVDLIGDYEATFSKWGNPGQIWKSGIVKGFHRKRLGPWDLLKAALNDALKGRD